MISISTLKQPSSGSDDLRELSSGGDQRVHLPPFPHRKHHPPPPFFYLSPPPPSPPPPHRHPTRHPCLGKREFSPLKLVIQGRVVYKIDKGLEGARVKVECFTGTDAKDAYGYTNSFGNYEVMVSGLEIGTADINYCATSLAGGGKTRERSSDLTLKFVTKKEVVLQAKDIVAT